MSLYVFIAGFLAGVLTLGVILFVFVLDDYPPYPPDNT